MSVTTRVDEFRQQLPMGGRLMGIDVGSRTLGLAFCDAGWTIASPASTIQRGKFVKDLAALGKWTLEQQVVGVVVGLPLSLDGTDTPQTQSTRAFAANIAALERPVLLWDERWSTQAVTRLMISADASRATRDRVVDQLAASYILQGAIDALRA
jgi:putative Holliday junction resolvase